MLRKILPYSKGVLKFFFIVFIISLLLSQVGIFAPQLFKIFIDKVIIGKDSGSLFIVIGGAAAIFIFSSAMSGISTYSSNRFFNRLLFNISHAVWKNYLYMPAGEFDKYTAGDLKMRMDEDVKMVEGFVNSQTYSIITTMIALITLTFYMLFISWKLFLLTIIFVPLTFALGKMFGKREQKLAEDRRNIIARRDEWMHNSVQGWKEVKALSIEKGEMRTFVKYFHKSGIIEARWRIYWIWHVFLLPIIKDEFIMKFSLYFVGALFIMSNDITVGGLLIMVGYSNSFLGNINAFNETNIGLRNSIPGLSRMLEIISEDKEISRKDKFYGKLRGDIRFNDVSFSYNDEQGSVLNNIDIYIEAGEKVAVVGKSGAGKSTIAKLMLGLISCRNGTIMYDGKNIADLHPLALHKNIGVVMQDSILFNMTIRENLRLARYNATDEEFDEACRRANIMQFIDNLPERYNTLIGEKGVKLSGGQKQRLAIARVFLSDPGIIIFDEATSSLDNESERMIHDIIKNISADKTIIIIAHRLSSLLLADKVIVMNDGRVAAIGHHDELLNKNAAYDDLFKEQYFEAK